MHADEILTCLSDPPRLTAAIADALQAAAGSGASFVTPVGDASAASAVLFLLGFCEGGSGRPGEVGLVLNKRSRRVRQPGDLCCPGGGVARVDFAAARLLALPCGPLARWPHGRRWRRERPLEARWVALYLATALREAFEEMRLNPLRVQLLGPLPPNRLNLFRREVYPLAAWTSQQSGYRPNWEVDRIVHLPLSALLDPSRYICYRVARPPGVPQRLPAFRLPGGGGGDILWGVTYRIAMDFMKIVFGFEAPLPEGLPVVDGELAEGYPTGEGNRTDA